jgi:exonuclease SbcC
VWIESLTAIAFGPFRDARLDFGRHLTVIYGPNEAGKSSWHAAIYSALCGIRRARGVRGEDRDFADQYRPWSGDDWEVHATVRLDDGRRVELRQNLADLAHCSAEDADLGRDVSSEILNEGTPDAAKWLGLDRTSFLSVACVRQAQVRALADNASSLQDELQRAAASAARDATASEAIGHLEEFVREQVGQDRANSTKPLQRAKTRLAAAESALQTARDKHARWLTFEVRALEARNAAEDAARTLRMHQAVQAGTTADGIEAKAEKARQLSAKHPHGPSPPLPEEETLARDVAAALSEWEHRPEVAVVTGPSVATLQVEVDALPAMPTGEQSVAPELTLAKSAYERASHALELHEQQPRPEPPAAGAKGLTGDQLRDLARSLEMTLPTVDSELEERYREAQSRVNAAAVSPLRWALAILAAVVVVGGASTWALYSAIFGPALIATGLALFGWLVFGFVDAARTRALDDVRTIEVAVLAQRQAIEAAKQQVREARAHAKDLRLGTDPKALRALADDLLLADQEREAATTWSSRQQDLVAQVTVATIALEELLREHGVTDTADVAAAYAQYEAACRLRSELAARATTRQGLVGQLSAQDAAERAIEASQTRRSDAERQMLDTAARCGVVTANPAEAIDALTRWQQSRAEALATFDTGAREYAELQALLSGESIEVLEGLAVQRRSRAVALAAEFTSLPDVADDSDFDAGVAQLAEIAQATQVAAAAAEAQSLERSHDVPSIAEAEEALEAAKRESERVRCLSQTLSSTLEFLRAAEERVHRDIAPALALGLRRWLPAVTQGRYTDARVDPSDLSVKVLGPDGEWRDAQRLSHGTAEQIYLLLRVVLAERLATTGESCPLLLDDVLVQTDAVRKRALLDVMLSVSRDRQVILLTQEDDVMRWAEQRLGADDRLIMLSVPL